ncbi:TPA: hypothetical protein SAY52_004339 [Burkholderia cenocepacia]|uniref:hypothetical protein n=1 Tax=unclassified Burkholderia TaxID=2613784 RepID=UPI00158A6988|nr:MULTISPECIES: hypothetical protein [unclassified Burkholderia]HEF5873682.1 hypothetical protein [Burkholderia cenocepacia]
MPTPAEKQIKAQIDLLLDLKLVGMDPVDKSNLQSRIERIQTQYELAVEKGKTSARYKDLSDSIAKNLPALVNGIYAADKAFKKGDYISASASMMSICASVLPILTAATATSGPVGVLIGALLSVVAQILSFFAPQQPSLESKIQKMLDQLKTDEEIDSIKGFGHSISSYASSLRWKCSGEKTWMAAVALPGTVSLTKGSANVVGTGTKFSTTAEVGQWLTFDSDAPTKPYQIEKIDSDTSLTLATKYDEKSLSAGTYQYRRQKIVKRSIDEILGMPLTNETEADAFMTELIALDWGLGRDQAKLDSPVFLNWKVAAYLQKPSNQSKEGWPEVLGLWCQTYIELLTANTMLSCMISREKLEAVLAATREENTTSPLSKGVRRRCHEAVLYLGALVKALPISWEGDKREMLKILTAVRPVARERGLYLRVGRRGTGLGLYVARGNGRAAPFAWDYKSNTGWLGSLSIHTPKAQIDSFTPKYELLATEKGPSRVSHFLLDSVSGNLSDTGPVIGDDLRDGRNPETYLDVSGLAFNDGTFGVEGSTHPKTLVSLAIENRMNDARYVNYYTIGKDGKATRVNVRHGLANLAEIRSVYAPASALSDDPDGDALTGDNQPKPNSVLTYGGIRNKNQLYVTEESEASTVEGPEGWKSYNAIEVDAHYVWLFGKGGIACATHASMLKCRRGKIARPSWIHHDFDTQFNRPEVANLYPCADGTLLVAMLGNIYTADYSIDRKASRVVTSSWVKRGGDATQVVKMPIPCWSILEQLNACLLEE